ncbi:uncharacterized protein BX663DRAFT_484356 [Cokeromyces recurvatus]|uniref:uncharacterized protein n=1 Tax=Cokeromyces recurvatus TaxID=90255 RepID=UPI00221EF899|nr:uncharacterized protein BX663DRAFT_484356 [Cokeromyces recurvatus]KAI7905020.1 hypothetical protein BX663DRAFT_484356 [Cokeromyces recurvatus]
MCIDYFYHTPAKSWNAIDATCYYDSKSCFSSTFELLAVIKSDLVKVNNTQITFKKFVISSTNEIERLMNLTVHKKFHQDSSKDNTQENQGGSEEKRDNRSSNVACAPFSKEQNILMKVSDTLNNYGKMTISSISAIPATRSAIVERKRQYEEDSPDMSQASFPENHLTKVREGKNHYRFEAPSARAESLHMPKLRKTQLEALKKMCHFGTSFCSNEQTFNEYKACINEQMQNSSLRSLEMFDCLVSLLEKASFDNFNETLWAFKPDFALTTPSKAFLDIVKYTLCSFHLSCRSIQEFAQNHERTHFVENIIPSLLALSKCYWACGIQMPPGSIYQIKSDIFILNDTFYSGILKEHTTRTVEDSLKILECSMSALRKEASHYKNASKKTFEELKVFSVHVVTTQVTLCEMSFHDENN